MCVPGCQESVRHALSRRGLLKGAMAFGLAGSASVSSVVSAAAFTAPAGQFTSVVDLTHVMSPEFPTFFGVPGLALEKKFDLSKDGFNLNWWHIIEHAGTHLDAPIHFSADGRSADQIPANTLVVPLVVLDVAAMAAANPDYLVSRNNLLAWEERHGRFPENSCIAMHSGWAEHVVDAAKFTGKDAAGVFHFPVSVWMRPSGCWRNAMSRDWRLIRCRWITARPRISKCITPGCRQDVGGLRMSPVSTRCRHPGQPWLWACPR